MIYYNFDSVFVGKQPLAESLCPTLFHSSLESRVEQIISKIRSHDSWKLEAAEMSDLKKAFSLANSVFASKLKKTLGKILPADLNKLLEAELLSTGRLDGWITSIIRGLDENDLRKVCGISKEQETLCCETQKKLKNTALKSVLETRSLAVLNELSTETFYFIDHTLNLFIEALGLRELGASNNNMYTRRFGGGGNTMAKSKLETYLAILLYPSVIFGSLLSVLGNPPVVLALTACICAATILFLIFYDRYLAPCPKKCEGFTNLNMKVKRGDRDPTYAREALLKKIERSFEKNKGVLLIGGSGVGKTATVEALAERIVQKSSSNAIKGAQIFFCSANSLGRASYQDGVSFSEFTETFDRHEKEVIAYIREVAAAFKPKQSGEVSDDIKILCDNFPYIICDTTQEEFTKWVKEHAAFLRRVDKIEVKPFSPEEIKAALYQYLHHKHPELLGEEGVIAYICEKALEFMPNTSQIDAAKCLLTSAMFKATHLTFDALEDEISELSMKRDLLANELLHKAGAIHSTEYLDICKKLEAKEKELRVKNGQLDRLRKMETIYENVWRKGFSLANRQWLENQTLVQLMQQAIANYKKELGLPERLSIQLIDETIKEETEVNSTKSH